MAHFIKSIEGFSASQVVKIKSTEQVESHTVYVIEITLGPYKWTVKHRYSEFHELHDKLVILYKLDKNLLPPKKVFGNLSESFIRKRQGELEIYIQTILHNFANVPALLAEFLEFNKYEIHGLTQSLAEELFHKGDLILEAGEIFYVEPLQLHAIMTRLKLPEPTCGSGSVSDSGDATKDLGHVLDFITRLKYLKIVGTDSYVGSSNLIVNQLPFELTSFKSIESLELVKCNCEKISGVEHLKQTLKKLQVHNTVKAIKDVMLVDIGAGQWLGGHNEAVLVPVWSNLTSADFSANTIQAVDESVKLMPMVEYLDLSHNKLEDIQHVQYLSALTHLDLSYNNIHTLNSLHTKLGNVKTLILCNNKLESLLGFSKLYSLTHLDISYNDISQVLEVRHISGLPCLETVSLINNPVTIVVDYRTKILELFGDRAREVCLDGQLPTQKELDTVAILLAIQKSKEMKERAKKQSKKPAVEVQIAESGSPRASGSSSSSALGGATASSSAHQGAPQCHAPRHPELFRMQVEAIREQGGAAWLALLNQMTSSSAPSNHHSDPSDRNSSPSNHDSAPNIPGNLTPGQNSQSQPDESITGRARQESLDGSRIRLPNSTSSNHDGDGLNNMQSMGFMLPETLPGKSDGSLTVYLQSLVPNSHALSQMLGEERRREERPFHVMWCQSVCYTDPHVEIPACVYITTENLHLFHVKALSGKSGLPLLDHIYCIPLLNMQQIVIGYQDVYLRIEEAFVGPPGTFSFMTCSPHKTEVFMEMLRIAVRRALPPEVEGCEEPHIMINGETELKLKSVINQVECLPNLAQVPIVLYMLVQSPDVTRAQKPYTTHSLVLTDRYLYLIKEDYIFSPQPTFGIGPSTRPQFEIVYSFPVTGRITGIQMYDMDTFNRENDTLPNNIMATSSGSTLSPHFIGFGVKLSFEMGPTGPKELDIRVSTSGMRDRFLATLTQVRKELSERSPSPPKSKSRKSRNHEHKKTLREKESSGSSRDSDSQSSSSHSLISFEQVKEVKEQDADVPMATDEQDANIAIATASAAVPEPEPAPSTSAISPLEIDPPVKIIEKPAVKVTPPKTLSLNQYPTMKLLGHLTQCNENMSLLKSLSEPMLNLASMTGEELINFFHSQIAQIGSSSEELHHIMWTMVTPYLNVQSETLTCLMLSTKAVYLVATKAPKLKGQLPIWKTHSRNKSDSVLSANYKKTDSAHHSSGILYTGNKDSAKHLRAYASLTLRELKQLNIGLFDQSLRLTGESSDKVYACITRDNSITEDFIKNLMSILSTVVPSPSPDVQCPDSEPDIYRTFGRPSRSESQILEFTHPSKVKFVYPSEDAVSDLTYLLVQNIRGKKPDINEVHILQYLLLYHLDSPEGDTEIFSKAKPRTLILTNSHIFMAVEDHVSYPLPDFVKGLPEAPNFDMVEERSLEFLKRIVVSDFTSHDITLVFSDESEEIVVDTSLEHYTPGDLSPAFEAKTSTEITWTLVIQNMRDRDRLLKLLTRQWSEIHEGKELSVQVSG